MQQKKEHFQADQRVCMNFCFTDTKFPEINLDQSLLKITETIKRLGKNNKKRISFCIFNMTVTS